MDRELALVVSPLNRGARRKGEATPLKTSACNDSGGPRKKGASFRMEPHCSVALSVSHRADSPLPDTVYPEDRKL